ncbi:MAG: hypothetical protein SXV54_25375 [Chloroflexota bacterium]|nr:hypothetical protein [Chloroflexota bacterium]
MSVKTVGSRLKPVGGAIVFLVAVMIIFVPIVNGYGSNVKQFWEVQRWSLASRVKAVRGQDAIQSTDDFTNIVFLHHSVGENLIQRGSVRERFSQAGYEFWDHGYNFSTGLVRPDGSRTGYSYVIPDDNTDPDGLARVFGQRVYAAPLNALSGLLQHDVIVFKSCFPVSDIRSDESLEEYKARYLHIRDVVDVHPNKIFIVVTQPPLNPAMTDPGRAARARALANWLTSGEFLDGHSNLFAFDFFDHLAEEDPAAPDFNMLRAAYREDDDSHPNEAANQEIAPLFTDFVLNAIETYRSTYAESDTQTR